MTRALDLSKILIYEFYYDYMIAEQSEKTVTFYTCILAASRHQQKQMISIKILPMMLINSLAHQIMMKEEEKNHNLQQKNKKVFGLIKDKRGG